MDHSDWLFQDENDLVFFLTIRSIIQRDQIQYEPISKTISKNT